MLNLPQNPKWDIARVSHSTLVNADCFDVFPFIEDKSIDAIICDLPYGTTQNKWDSILPLDKLWKQYERILKETGVIILTASQPFTSILICSNLPMFKHEWIWIKNKGSNYLNAKREPMKEHEQVLVFSKGKYTYNRILEERSELGKQRHKYGYKSEKIQSDNYGAQPSKTYNIDKDLRIPKSYQRFIGEHGLHPTQKPITLLEYFIKTYTNEGDMVLDNTTGSGTTNLACLKLNRKSIGIEKEKQYYDVAVRRLSSYCG